MEERPATADSNDEPPRSFAAAATGDAASLTTSLHRLTIDTDRSSHLSIAQESPRRPSDHPPSPATPRSKRPPSRRASGAPSDNAPSSPNAARRTSGAFVRPNSATNSPARPTFGRSASGTNFRSTSIISNSSAATTPPIEPPPMTPASVAAAYLKQDLLRHDKPDALTNKPQTVVIVHDSCYGHRYSRPKTSKSTLSLIVERPERIQAGVLGLSAAYTRLGGRYTGAQSPPHPNRTPDGSIPFYIRRTNRFVPLTSSAVTNVHGTKWMAELKSMCEAAETKLAAGGKELTRPIGSPGAGVQQPKPKLHEGDLYLCKESLDAFQGALGGVFDGVDAVFQGSAESEGVRRAFVCIRPPGHHCSSDYPSGFCWLNNVHVGIEHAVQTHGLTHAAIIDFDLHHGDGSQAIAWQRNARPVKVSKAAPSFKRAAIGYFSLHDINSYPCEWGDTEKVQSASLCIENAHGQSIWNVHLQPWKTEEDFWELYRSRYSVLLEKTRTFLRTHTEKLRSNPTGPPPKSAIFLSAGFDASEWEGEGMQRHKVNVPTTFYARFTADVIRLAQEEGSGADGRVISVLEGGYSDRALTSGILSHITGLVDSDLLDKPGARNLQTTGDVHDENRNHGEQEDPTKWWNDAALSELEKLRAPIAVPEASKKPRYGEPPTYTSSTQSFTAKMIDPSKIRRSISGMIQTVASGPEVEKPPPEVSWATAAFELSKVLIPTDRQIDSCKHEELSEPRIKKERPSANGAPVTEAKGARMQLRGRKANLTDHAEVDSEPEVPKARTASQSSRRQTMPPGPLLTDEVLNPSTSGFMHSTAQSRRRSSVGSTAHSVNSEFRELSSDLHAPSAAPTVASESLGVRKTRRQSGVNAQSSAKLRASEKAPPVPKIPVQHDTVQDVGPCAVHAETHGSAAAVNSEPTAVDDMTSGFKKLVLKMPANEAAAAQSAPQKAPRKAPAPKVPKTAAPRKPRAIKKTPVQTPVKEGQGPILASESNGLLTEPIVSSPVVGKSPFEPVGPRLPHETNVVSTPKAIDSGLTVEPDQVSQPEAASTGNGVPNDAEEADTQMTGYTTQQPPTQHIIQHPVAALGASDDPASSSSIPPTLPDATQILQAPTATPAADFIPYEPPGPWDAAAKGKLQQEPLTWLPPNSSTPVALRRGAGKENLPVFTSDGHIPFALAPVSAGKGAGAEPGAQLHGKSEARDVWEVPATPAKD